MTNPANPWLDSDRLGIESAADLAAYLLSTYSENGRAIIVRVRVTDRRVTFGRVERFTSTGRAVVTVAGQRDHLRRPAVTVTVDRAAILAVVPGRYLRPSHEGAPSAMVRETVAELRYLLGEAGPCTARAFSSLEDLRAVEPADRTLSGHMSAALHAAALDGARGVDGLRAAAARLAPDLFPAAAAPVAESADPAPVEAVEAVEAAAPVEVDEMEAIVDGLRGVDAPAERAILSARQIRRRRRWEDVARALAAYDTRAAAERAAVVRLLHAAAKAARGAQ